MRKEIKEDIIHLLQTIGGVTGWLVILYILMQ